MATEYLFSRQSRVRREIVGPVEGFRVNVYAESGEVRGELPAPGKIFIAARFQTADPEYAWLNRIQAIGVGMNQGETNSWDLYALRSA